MSLNSSIDTQSDRKRGHDDNEVAVNEGDELIGDEKRQKVDEIEKNSGQQISLEKSSSSSSSKPNESEDDSPYNWCQYFDTENRPYYYNLITKRTQWEKPSAFKETAPIVNTSIASYGRLPISDEDNLQFRATFNKRSGAFGGSSAAESWDKIIRPLDRDVRQMSAFFDVNEFERNREEAKMVREKIAKSNIDWKKYNEEKKLKKLQKAKEWLLKDDP